MNDHDHHDLVESCHRDNWGFVGGLGALVSQPLINVRLPRWMSQRWMITTTQMQYIAGVQAPPSLSGFVVPFGLPPNNSLLTTGGNQPIQLNVQWGNGGITEFAVIDYPFAGSTFSLAASQVQLSVNSSSFALINAIVAAGQIANIGAFISGGGVSKETYQWPTYTTQQFNLSAAANPSLIAVPARARAYRITYTGGINWAAAGPETGLVVNQLNNVTGPNVGSMDYAGDNNAVVGQGGGESAFALQSVSGAATLQQFVGTSARRIIGNIMALEAGTTCLSIQQKISSSFSNSTVTVCFFLDLG